MNEANFREVPHAGCDASEHPDQLQNCELAVVILQRICKHKRTWKNRGFDQSSSAQSICIVSLHLYTVFLGLSLLGASTGLHHSCMHASSLQEKAHNKTYCMEHQNLCAPYLHLWLGPAYVWTTHSAKSSADRIANIKTRSSILIPDKWLKPDNINININIRRLNVWRSVR